MLLRSELYHRRATAKLEGLYSDSDLKIGRNKIKELDLEKTAN
jgi:hypothetical protein